MKVEPSPKSSVVFVDGCRTPFLRSGTEFIGLTSYDLARSALEGMLARGHVRPDELDRVVLGTVIQNPANSNVARDAALAAGVPESVPASTVTMACISANRAVADVAADILTGQAEIGVAGGTEALSDVPVGFPKDVRERFFAARKYRNLRDWLGFFRGVRPSDLLPRAPGIAEFSTGETMGESGDKLAASFGVTREEQDAYALESHRRAAAAWAAGHLDADVHPVLPAPTADPVVRDNVMRPDSSLEALAKLKPAFVKPFGTITAGNATPLTDGASAVLLMREDVAMARGLPRAARLRAWTFVAQDPGDELLLGPAYAVPALLERTGLAWSDLDVIEIHEAFAGQVLAVFRALESERFAREKLGRSSAVASIDPARVNAWGGSLGLGHPFGATGTRLLTMAARRLQVEDGRWALVTACAAGGLGHAMLVERVDG